MQSLCTCLVVPVVQLVKLVMEYLWCMDGYA